MALLDIDRHILQELAQNTQGIEKCMPAIQRAIKLNERNQALVLHLVNAVRDIDTGKGKEYKPKVKQKGD